MPNYETFTIKDALTPRPKTPQLVKGIIPAGSVSIWYGYPGSLKSALVMDMAMAVATGQPWLPAMPNSGVVSPGFPTMQAPVLWIDIDNGYEVTAERVAAFARAYKAPPDTPFYFMSYPTPSVQASRAASIASLEAHILSLPQSPRLMVLDTLLRAAHVKDENSSEMDTVMNNLHKMAEDIASALMMVSHSKKENNGRAGNGLRGHSSIEGGVDSVFNVKRENKSDVIQIENQKARRKPTEDFSARWTYQLDVDQESLYEARFWFEPSQTMSKQQATILNLCQKIVDNLTTNGAMNQSDLYSRIKGDRTNFNTALSKLVQDGSIVTKAGSYNSTLYQVP
jgi:hypothetical protein